ncbi:MAG: hypothetical protein DRJ64_02095 [Thermoprotei archaeon]|nr:MAG: hypothetical protein DRJ64_02095 [Thermoprotei archaeon]
MRRVLLLSFTPGHSLDGKFSKILREAYNEEIDLNVRYWYDIRDFFIEVISYGMSGVEVFLYFENREVFERFSKLEALRIMDIQRYMEVYGGKIRAMIGNKLYDLRISGALFELVPTDF